MSKSRLETKVGLFVLVGLVVLAVLLLQFSKGNRLWRGTYTLYLHTVNVDGIRPRASVLLAGVPVGNVTDITLDPSGTNVTLTLLVYNKTRIYHDARFVIEQSGFLGDRYVSIIPTENRLPVLANGDSVASDPPFNLQEAARGAAGFIRRMDETAQKLDASVTDLRRQVLNAEVLAHFGASITNLQITTDQARATVQDIRNLVSTNGAQLSLTTSNAARFSAELLRLSDAAQDLLATNAPELHAALNDLSEAAASFRQLAADVQAGRGLAGTLLQNPELATNVQSIAANLAVTSSNLNRVGLWGILWSHRDTPAQTNLNRPANLPTTRR